MKVLSLKYKHKGVMKMDKGMSYFTHLIGLWMANEKGICDDMRELKDNAADRTMLSVSLRCYYEDRMPESDGFASDMIEASLDHVDWDFLADELAGGLRHV